MIDLECGDLVIAHQEEQEAAAIQIIQQLKKFINRKKRNMSFVLFLLLHMGCIPMR
jgi:hypothetical protein